jgi:hypothetical protein
MGFIYHSSSADSRPTTKIQWSKEIRHSGWRQWPINTWGEGDHSGLALDVVTLRDIAENEEILIDYGEA